MQYTCSYVFIPYKVNTIVDNINGKNKKKHPKYVRKLLCKKKKIWRSMKVNKNYAKNKYKQCISMIKQAKLSNDLTPMKQILSSRTKLGLFIGISALD